MTIKGRDLPHVYTDDNVKFVLVPDNKELEVAYYCKHTQDMSDGTVTIYLKHAEKEAE